MPISPVYDWSESDDSVEVRVQLQGAASKATDVFATDCLLKINSAPYLLILDLFGFVEEKRTVATITKEGVTFRLTKVGGCMGFSPPLQPHNLPEHPLEEFFLSALLSMPPFSSADGTFAFRLPGG